MMNKQNLFLAACMFMLVALVATGCQKNNEKPSDKSLSGTVWGCEQYETGGVYHKLELQLMDNTFKFTFVEKSGYEKSENEYTGSYRYADHKLTLNILQANGGHVKHNLVVNGNTCIMKFEGRQYTLIKKN
ncbi:hypothetical protein QYZ87_06790 [Porphyromonadaceae bacterium W3.11]|nr:hypothetical protein [Porphyromonadaceae bacterium W3.11]